jgi:hypothetical protein
MWSRPPPCFEINRRAMYTMSAKYGQQSGSRSRGPYGLDPVEWKVVVHITRQHVAQVPARCSTSSCQGPVYVLFGLCVCVCVCVCVCAGR